MEIYALNYEVNFLTEDDHLVGKTLCSAVKAEFDLIRTWQSMEKLFGVEARSILDNCIALSLRKMLCDKKASILKLCPHFKMPPLTGEVFNCPGENDDMKLVEIHPYISIKPESEWISVDEWLNESIAWIEKDADSIPDAYSNRFFSLLTQKLTDKKFFELFECVNSGNDRIWCVKNKREVYEILKANGYYNLTIRTLIKHIADKNGAHLDDKKSIWIRMANDSGGSGISAVSAFATHMIYAATKQIDGLHDYFIVSPVMETLLLNNIDNPS